MQELWRGQLRYRAATVTEKCSRKSRGRSEVGCDCGARSARGVVAHHPRSGTAIIRSDCGFVGSAAALSQSQRSKCLYRHGAERVGFRRNERRGPITKHGSRLVRSLLVEVAWAGLRHNPWVRQTYQRISGGKKSRKKIAIVAVGRRLLVRCWAMLRDGSSWRTPAYPQRAKSATGRSNRGSEDQGETRVGHQL